MLALEDEGLSFVSLVIFHIIIIIIIIIIIETNRGYWLDTQKNCLQEDAARRLHRQQHRKKLFVLKKFSSPPCKKIMVRPLVKTSGFKPYENARVGEHALLSSFQPNENRDF